MTVRTSRSLQAEYLPARPHHIQSAPVRTSPNHDFTMTDPLLQTSYSNITQHAPSRLESGRSGSDVPGIGLTKPRSVTIGPGREAGVCAHSINAMAVCNDAGCDERSPAAGIPNSGPHCYEVSLWIGIRLPE